MIRLLTKEEYPTLEPIFTDEFQGSQVPDPRHAHLISEFQRDRMAGFAVMESTIFFGQIYVYPEFRGSGTARRLINYVRPRIPPGKSVFTIASEPRFGKLFERFGFYQLPGTIYECDF